MTYRMQNITVQPDTGRRRRVRPGLVALCILLAFTMIAAGCGKSRSADTDISPAARDTTLRLIAADYARTGDLTQAQSALDKLGLANPTQLLVSLAETDASAGRAAGEVAPMARLAEALGARSAKLVAYLEPTPTAVPPTSVPSPVPPSPTEPPTAIPATEPPPATPEPPTVTPTAEPQTPRAVADGDVNLRGGPGKAYPVAGKLLAGQEAEILGRNASGDWWQLAWPGGKQAWVAGTVVQILGPIDTVAVAKNIPAPPVQPTRPPQPTAAPAAATLRPQRRPARFPSDRTSVCGELKRTAAISMARLFSCGGSAISACHGYRRGRQSAERCTIKICTRPDRRTISAAGQRRRGSPSSISTSGAGSYIVEMLDGRNVPSDTARGMSYEPTRIAD